MATGDDDVDGVNVGTLLTISICSRCTCQWHVSAALQFTLARFACSLMHFYAALCDKLVDGNIEHFHVNLPFRSSSRKHEDSEVQCKVHIRV